MPSDLMEQVTNPVYPQNVIQALIRAEEALALAEAGFSKEDRTEITLAHEIVREAIQPLFIKQGVLELF